MTRELQPHLRSVVTTATAVIGLPLSGEHAEYLAREITPAVKALIAEAVAAAEENAPIPLGLAPAAWEAVVGERARIEVETTEYAGCVSRISADVDHDAPAALLAARLRGTQWDVTATDVVSPTYLGVTVRPGSVDAWRWWLRRLTIASSAVTVRGADAHVVGEHDGVSVELRGEGVGALLANSSGLQRSWDTELDSPAGTVATKARRQPDVIAVEILDAHTVELMLAPASLTEWRWWLTQLCIDPASVTRKGTAVVATGSRDGATVRVRAELAADGQDAAVGSARQNQPSYGAAAAGVGGGAG